MAWASVFLLQLAVLICFIASAVGECDEPVKSANAPNRSVCYEYVGCFDDLPPFNNAKGKLPRSPQELGTKYRLYSLQNDHGQSFELLDYRNVSTVTSSHFVASKPIKFVIHGFYNNGDAPWVLKMKDSLLKKGDFNVVVIDWGEGAKMPDYNQAVANLRLVGTEVKLMLEVMVGQGSSLSQVHLIGHSLGAHLAGHTGFLTNSTVGRISGLDPAGPDFECLPTKVRLDPGDAVFVDVIHTNGEALVVGGAGSFQQSGHVDFFVNGGKTQPGCKDGFGGAVSTLFSQGVSAVGDGISCSHFRSHEVFIESILTHCPFTAFPCENYDKFTKGECMSCGHKGCSSVGYFADQFYSAGKFFLSTRSSSPFCGFHYAIQINSSTSTKGTLYVALQGPSGITDFMAVTTLNDKIKSGQTIDRVVVFRQDVGPVTSLLIKYVKYNRFSWFGGVSDTFSVQGAQVISGDTGDRFDLELGNAVLQNNQEQAFPVRRQ